MMATVTQIALPSILLSPSLKLVFSILVYFFFFHLLLFYHCSTTQPVYFRMRFFLLTALLLQNVLANAAAVSPISDRNIRPHGHTADISALPPGAKSIIPRDNDPPPAGKKTTKTTKKKAHVSDKGKSDTERSGTEKTAKAKLSENIKAYEADLLKKWGKVPNRALFGDDSTIGDKVHKQVQSLARFCANLSV